MNSPHKKQNRFHKHLFFMNSPHEKTKSFPRTSMLPKCFCQLKHAQSESGAFIFFGERSQIQKEKEAEDCLAPVQSRPVQAT